MIPTPVGTAERARWLRIVAILDALEGIPESERDAALARLCPDDPGIRDEVRALLAADRDAEAYFDHFARELDPASVPDLAGKRIGPYRLLRLLGRGGMGVVYEAERDDGAYDKRVALKLLSLALAGTEAHHRFLAERRILAALEHPSIARIVDGGVTEDGTPWFAMEHVEGEPIDVYCNRRKLHPRARIELFLQICDAVEHAHRRLVVHRDLKPANVLITSDGRVKLLDFGIAKLLSDDADVSEATRTAMRLMTPAYASPEQVRGDTVTTASDVYQLGVMLYELLTGKRPYELPHAGAAEIERTILEQMPARGLLPRDLDTIALKALSKEPARRYGSADRLAQDLRRYLEARPVLARPDTWLYRSRKFVERHAIVVLVAIVALGLTAGMAAYHTVRVRRERDAARTEENRARAEAAKADQMSRFLTGLFRGADPSVARGAELTARELVDRGARQIDRDLAGEPEVQEQMLQVLGRTYMELGLYASAEPLFTRAVALAEMRVGARHPDYAIALTNVGALRCQQGEYRRALEPLEEAILILEPGPALAKALDALGRAYRGLGDHRKSIAAYQRAIALQTVATGERSAPIAGLLNSLGSVFTEIGEYARAEGLYSRALAIRERELGPDHPLVGGAVQNLAFVRSMQGKTEGLEAMYRRGVAIHRGSYGPVHPKVAASLGNLGHFLADAGRHEEAIDAFEQALDIYRASVRPDHPEICYALVSLGDSQRAAGRYREARRHYRRAIEVREKVAATQPFDPLLFHSLVMLSRVETSLGQTEAASRAANRALAIWRHAPDAVDPQVAQAVVELSRWLVERQRCAEAAPLTERAARLRDLLRGAARSKIADPQSLRRNCTIS